MEESKAFSCAIEIGGCLKCTATMEALLIDTNTNWGSFDVEAGASLEPDHNL